MRTSRHYRRAGPIAVAGAMLACIVPVGTAISHGASAQAKPPAATSPQQQAPPPSGSVEWLKDADGREYRLEAIPKAQAVKIADDKVRTMFGVPADLAQEDAQFYYVKLYRTRPAPITPTPRAPSSTPPRRTDGAKAPASAPASGSNPAAAAATESLPRVSQRLRFTTAGTGLPTGGQWREGLALADLTGDARPDIVASGARKTLRPPTVFTSDGAAWKAATGIAFPPRPYDYGGLALGDLNGDGILDIALGVHLRGLIALRSNADRTYADASTGLPYVAKRDEQVFSSRAIALVDCNADGRLDLVALGEGPRPMGSGGADASVTTGLATFVQQADGSWQRTAPGERNALFGATLAMADIDGDGKLDAIVAPGTLGDTRLVHRGDGACGWQEEAIAVVRPRSYVTTVAAGDLTGDGRADVVMGYTEFSTDVPAFGVDVLTRGSDGQWTRRALARDTGRSRIEAIAIGDLDGDRHADVVAVGAEGTATIFLNDGRGSFTREKQTLASPGGCAGSSAVIGDLDADGLGDLVISYAQEASPSAPGVCPKEGGIAAWKTAKAAAVAPARPASSPARR